MYGLHDRVSSQSVSTSTLQKYQRIGMMELTIHVQNGYYMK